MAAVEEWIYRQDQELPAYGLEWDDSEGSPIDFTSGWTYTLKLAKSEAASPVLTKTTGITGSATHPNIVVAWGAGELDVSPGEYLVFLRATSVNGDRRFKPGHEPTIKIVRTPVAS